MKSRRSVIALPDFRPGGKGMIFLFCLFIAAVIWIINALSKNYTTQLSMIIVPSNVKEHVEFPVKISVKGQGFSLAKLYYRLNNSHFEVKNNSERIAIADYADTLLQEQNNFVQIVSSNPSVINIVQPAGIVSLKVPVKNNAKITFAKQYGISIPVLIKPDSVTITGTAAQVNKIKYIETQEVHFENLNHKYFGSIPLIEPGGVKIQEKKVWLFIPAEQFTEGQVNIPVTLLNGGLRARAVPENVTVVYHVPLSSYKHVNASAFIAEADVNERNNGKSAVFIRRKPKTVSDINVIPDEVTILIFD
jgi:hypothetical protein